MPRVRLSKRVVDLARPGPKELIFWDSDLPGFGLRVRPSGTKSFVAVYRAGRGRNAPLRKATLGASTKLTPDEARSLARKVIGAVAQGRDPAAERASARVGMTVAELAQAFLTEHVRVKRKPGTLAKYEHVITKHIIPRLGRELAEALTYSSVARLHLDLKDTPATANYAVAVLASMYSFAQARSYVPEAWNPALRIEKYVEHPRQRFLTSAELTRLGRALEEAEGHGIPWDLSDGAYRSKHLPKEANRRTVFCSASIAVRLLLLTGCRLREILHLRWADVDLERGILFLPDSKTGPKPIVLNSAALAVLVSLPREAIFVVPGSDPSRPRHDLKKLWTAVTKRAGLSSVRIHDLRHTFASYGAGGGLGLPIIGKLLGHSQLATTQRYAHLHADPLRAASNQIGTLISSALARAADQELES